MKPIKIALICLGCGLNKVCHMISGFEPTDHGLHAKLCPQPMNWPRTPMRLSRWTTCCFIYIIAPMYNANQSIIISDGNNFYGTLFDGYCIQFLQHSTAKSKLHECDLKHEVRIPVFYWAAKLNKLKWVNVVFNL